MLRAARILPDAAALAVLVTLAAAVAGCGSEFKLPTEKRVNVIPAEKAYRTEALWPGMLRVRDVLLTQRYGQQLFILFERPDSLSEGEVKAFPVTRPTPIPSIQFLHLNNAAALAAGGDGTGSPLNRVYVLDRGDTCTARRNPLTQQCSDPTGGWLENVSDLVHYWHVREYGLLGGDTLSTFTDTLMASVEGIAADKQGRVYVSGTAIIEVSDINNPRLRTRTFQSRIYRYARGALVPGVSPPDHRMPGANWHRDDSWEVVEGSGIGSVVNPHGMEWMESPSASALYASDYDKNWIQRLSDTRSSTGAYQIDGAETGVFLFQAGDVASDADGFVYVCDSGNQRVLRYDSAKELIQRVDLETVSGTGPLTRPVAVAANDSLVFVADPGSSSVFKFKRRLR